MDRQIVLDDKSFKALSADSRVSILKSLGERRRTLSELSQKLNLGNSTVKEHCDILIQAELIKQMDEGRKWKYYELTQKGKSIVMPNLLDEVKVLIILCFGVIMIGAIAFFALQMFSGVGSAGAPYAANSITAPNLTKTISQSTGETVPMATTGATITDKNTDRNAVDQNRTALPAGEQNGNASPTGQGEAAPSCTNTVQCIATGNDGVTPEFFILSTMVSILFGIVLGWAVLRK